MTFFYDLNKRLAALAEKQNLAEHSVPATQPAKKSPLAQALNERDLGKHNNATTGFKALAKKAGGGNIEKGNRIAGAQLAKMRAKGQVEEGICPTCDCRPCSCNEGNAFSGAVAKAKADGIQKGETIKVGGKTYPVKEADMVGLGEKKKAKPDFLDIDGDGNRKETMKKAASDKKRSTGTAFDREHMDKLRKEKEAETHSRYDVKDTGYSKRYTRKTADTDINKDDEVKSDAPKKKGRPAGPAKGPERTTKGAWKHKGDRKVKENGIPVTDRGEYDNEGSEAKGDMHTVIRHATELERHLRDQENLPTWVIEKIGQIKGMMTSVSDYILSQHERGVEQASGEEGVRIAEKAVSKSQQKFMGMAHAMQKGKKIKGASPELKKVAKTMKPKDTHDFAATKLKGLPEKVKAKKESKKEEVEETTTSGSVAPVANAAPKAKGGIKFGQGVYESINREVESLMESMNVSVNMSTDEHGEPHKSITVSAEGAEADVLAQLLKAAGIDHQGGESCSTCGSTPCGCDQQVDENSPDWPTNTETLAADPNLRTYSGGLNGPKSTGQTTTPVLASQMRRQASMEESVELERSLFKTWKNYKG
jgi:hypothetical protein